jgi:8-oxo-dGTP diphosphatase
MIYDEKGNILVQNRKKNDWPGINLPGGHVEINESLEESCIREMKEETGLDVFNLEKVGFFEWNVLEKEERHLAVLYRTKDFKGTIKSSNEGEIFWVNIKDLDKYKLSVDLDKIIIECLKGINI